MNDPVEERLARQRAFWQGENHDRPVIGFTNSYWSGGVLALMDCSEGELLPGDVNVDRLLEYTGRQYEAWAPCSGDLFWNADVMVNFKWLPAVLGARIFIGGDSFWAEPFIRDYRRLDRLALDPGSAWLQTLWRLTDALAAQAGGRYPLATNYFMAPLTALAELRGNTELAFDLYDDPEGVLSALDRLADVWIALVCQQHDRVVPWHGGYTSGFRWVWAPGRIAEFDEDPSFMFKPRLHDRFVVPSHRKLIAGIEYPYIHLHSKQLHTLDRLLEIEELQCIELTPDWGADVLALIPTIEKIRRRKRIIFHGYMTAEEMLAIRQQVPPEGLCLIGRADTPGDAARLCEAVLA